MQARGFLNYRLEYCWPKVIYCICQPNELERENVKKTGGPSSEPRKNLGAMANRGLSLESPLFAIQFRAQSNSIQGQYCGSQGSSLHVATPISCQYLQVIKLQSIIEMPSQ